MYTIVSPATPPFNDFAICNLESVEFLVAAKRHRLPHKLSDRASEHNVGPRQSFKGRRRRITGQACAHRVMASTSKSSIARDAFIGISRQSSVTRSTSQPRLLHSRSASMRRAGWTALFGLLAYMLARA